MIPPKASTPAKTNSTVTSPVVSPKWDSPKTCRRIFGRSINKVNLTSRSKMALDFDNGGAASNSIIKTEKAEEAKKEDPSYCALNKLLRKRHLQLLHGEIRSEIERYGKRARRKIEGEDKDIKSEVDDDNKYVFEKRDYLLGDGTSKTGPAPKKTESATSSDAARRRLRLRPRVKQGYTICFRIQETTRQLEARREEEIISRIEQLPGSSKTPTTVKREGSSNLAAAAKASQRLKGGGDLLKDPSEVKKANNNIFGKVSARWPPESTSFSSRDFLLSSSLKRNNQLFRVPTAPSAAAANGKKSNSKLR